jgi:hypothetical protein
VLRLDVRELDRLLPVLEMPEKPPPHILAKNGDALPICGEEVRRLEQLGGVMRLLLEDLNDEEENLGRGDVGAQDRHTDLLDCRRGFNAARIELHVVPLSRNLIHQGVLRRSVLRQIKVPTEPIRRRAGVLRAGVHVGVVGLVRARKRGGDMRDLEPALRGLQAVLPNGHLRVDRDLVRTWPLVGRL